MIIYLPKQCRLLINISLLYNKYNNHNYTDFSLTCIFCMAGKCLPSSLYIRNNNSKVRILLKCIQYVSLLLKAVINKNYDVTADHTILDSELVG